MGARDCVYCRQRNKRIETGNTSSNRAMNHARFSNRSSGQCPRTLASTFGGTPCHCAKARVCDSATVSGGGQSKVQCSRLEAPALSTSRNIAREIGVIPTLRAKYILESWSEDSQTLEESLRRSGSRLSANARTISNLPKRFWGVPGGGRKSANICNIVGISRCSHDIQCREKHNRVSREK